MDHKLFKLDRITNIAAIVLLSLGIMGVFILPYSLTQYHSGIDFTETGQIGDTIGGITAPLIGFISAALIYLSFLAQRQANKLQWESIKRETAINNLDKIQNSLEAVSSELETLQVDQLYGGFRILADGKYSPSLFTDSFKSVIKKVSLYSRNYCFLYNRYRELNLDKSLEEHYRFYLEQENTLFYARFVSIHDHIRTYQVGLQEGKILPTLDEVGIIGLLISSVESYVFVAQRVKKDASTIDLNIE